MAVALETVVKQLTDSGIIAQGQLEKFVPPKAQPKDADELVAQLVKENHLTKFQAAQVAAGKTKSLILGGYTILDKIGAGGMGQVFKAHNRRMDRLVAIKMLPPAMTKDAAAVARFEREVRAAAKLRHTNIVAADDADQANGVHFLVMEYVEGQDLSALVKKNGPFPVAKATNYILQAARGLEFAHSEGVIHRDIKPANLLLDKKGTVKILDMGLARIESNGVAATQAELTGTGAVMGTVDYMAPEQGMSTKHADARADIYSLGCSLYYLIAGKATYDGETVAAKLVAHHTHPIPDLRTVRPEVSEPLEAVFKKMVAKKIEDRYQTMTDVIADLERLGAGGQSSTNIPLPETTNFDNSALTFLKGIEATPTIQKTRASKAAAKAGAGKDKHPPWKNPRVLIAAGAAGFLFVLLGVWVIIRDKDGQEVARVKVPEGGTATVQTPTPPKITSTPKSTGPTTPAPSPPTKSPAVAASSPPGTAPPPAVAPFDATKAKQHQQLWASHLKTDVVKPNSIGMQMTLIPPGEFLMGSSDADIALALKIAEETKFDEGGVKRIQEERPQHKVRITKPFRLAAHEVTIGQFAKFVEQSKYKTQAEEFGGNSDRVKPEEVKPDSLKVNWRTPGQAVTDDSPVTQVSWYDAVAFCNWLSGQEQLTPCYQRDGDSWTLLTKANGYRLPTEAEWEYCCRAGTATQFWFGDNWQDHDKYGWSNKNAGGRPHTVGSLPANPFGLYDLHGNVWEWCQDWYDGKWYEKSPSDDPVGPSRASYRVLRGGSWYSMPAHSRSSYRINHPPSHRINNRGFRPALSSVGAQPSK